MKSFWINYQFNGGENEVMKEDTISEIFCALEKELKLHKTLHTRSYENYIRNERKNTGRRTTDYIQETRAYCDKFILLQLVLIEEKLEALKKKYL